MKWWVPQVNIPVWSPGGSGGWGTHQPVWSKSYAGKGKGKGKVAPSFSPVSSKGKGKVAKGKGKGKLNGSDADRRELLDGQHTGSLLKWAGKYGWIAPDVPIEHTKAAMHDGRVYASAGDLVGVPEEDLSEGVRLSFGVYADGKGIGARQVRLEDSEGETAEGEGSEADHSKGAPWRVQRTIEKKPALAQKGGPRASGACGAGKGKVAPIRTKGCSKVEPKNGKGSAPGFKGPGPRRDKTTHSGQIGMLRWASSEVQGWRPAMEDAVIAKLELPAPLESYAMFGVFDGHGGAEVSRRTAADLPDLIVEHSQDVSGDIGVQALELGLPALDEKLRQDGEGQVGMLPAMAGGKPILSDVKNAFGLMGSTAVVALLECEGSPAEGNPHRVVVANVGDSRAALCRDGVAVPLSEDHKPDSPIEKARIEAAGGFVAAVGPCMRVDGWGLNLSRALGDFHYKGRDDLPYDEQKVSCQPDMRVEEITEQDEFLFLGCDGVFELHSTQSAIDIARAAILEGKRLEEVVEELVDACVSPDLMRTCGQGGDNVSAMIIMLRPDVGQS